MGFYNRKLGFAIIKWFQCPKAPDVPMERKASVGFGVFSTNQISLREKNFS
jgi:hypothetical protein